MLFVFPETGETATTVQVCEELCTNYGIHVTPSELENAKTQNPNHEFFKQMEKWSWKLSKETTSDKIGYGIREAARELGFTVTEA